MGVSYISKKKLGEGTYAAIFLADQVQTECECKMLEPEGNYVYLQTVAIKRIKKTDYSTGIEVSAIREIKALQKIRNEYVIKILDIFGFNGLVNIVLEYAESNLEIILKNKNVLIMPSDIKAWMLMILKGTYACHKKFVVHRDIKPNNILVQSNGILKLADFGLAKDLTGEKMTSNIVTRWYRAPELILGAVYYGFGIDIWAIGCIFAELFLRIPLFPGNDDFGQLELIFKALGTPTVKDWPGFTKLPNYVKYPDYPVVPLETFFTAASDDVIDLMKKMLIYDPMKRITCLNALKHSYFTNMPRPTLPEHLPFTME